jgi:hypothetical protein
MYKSIVKRKLGEVETLQNWRSVNRQRLQEIVVVQTKSGSLIHQRIVRMIVLL